MITGSVLFALVLFAVAAGLAAASGRRIGYTFFPAAAAAGLLSYALFAAGLSRLAPFMAAGLALFSAGYVFFSFFSGKRKNAARGRLLSLLLNTDSALFLLAVLLFLFLNYGRFYYLNDEFSHWGLAIKNMFTTGRLAVFAESTLYKTYPPFATVFCWLASAFTGGMNEAATFVGMDLLLFSCAMPLPAAFAERLRKSAGEENPRGEASRGRKGAVLSWLLTPWVAGAAVAAILCFKLSAFTVLSVDTLLGLIGAYIIMEHYASGRIAFSALAAAALALTKEIGIGIALFALVCCAIDSAVAKKHVVAVPPPPGRRKGSAGFGRQLIAPLAALAAWGSWRLVLLATQKSTAGSGNAAGGTVAAGDTAAGGTAAESTGFFTAVRQQTLFSFLKAWLLPRMSIGVPLLLVVAVLVAGSFLLARAGRKTAGKAVAARGIAAAVLLTVGCFLYAIGVLLTYWFRFSAYEAVQVASFERYFGTYLTMWLFVLLFGVLLLPGTAAFLRAKLPRRKEPQGSATARFPAMKKGLAAAFSVFPIVVMAVFYACFYPYSARMTAAFRADYAKTEQIAEVCQSSEGKALPVLFLTAGYENKDWLIAHYNAAPVPVDYREDWEAAVRSGEYAYIYIGKLTADGTTEEDLRGALAKYFADPGSTLREECLWRINRVRADGTGEEKIVFTQAVS